MAILHARISRPRAGADAVANQAAACDGEKQSYNEIEASEFSISGVAHAKQEMLIKYAIALVHGLTGKIQLRCQNVSARLLNLDVIMARASRIERWNDRRKPPTAARIGELMTAQPVAITVVRAMLIRVPKLDKCLVDGCAIRLQDKPGQGYPLCARCVGSKVLFEWGTRLVVWPFCLREGQFIRILACRRQNEIGLRAKGIGFEDTCSLDRWHGQKCCKDRSACWFHLPDPGLVIGIGSFGAAVGQNRSDNTPLWQVPHAAFATQRQ